MKSYIFICDKLVIVDVMFAHMHVCANTHTHYLYKPKLMTKL